MTVVTLQMGLLSLSHRGLLTVDRGVRRVEGIRRKAPRTLIVAIRIRILVISGGGLGIDRGVDRGGGALGMAVVTLQMGLLSLSHRGLLTVDRGVDRGGGALGMTVVTLQVGLLSLPHRGLLTVDRGVEGGWPLRVLTIFEV